MEQTKREEEERQQDERRVANFTLFDDTFMTKVFDGDIPSVRHVLRVILERPDLELITPPIAQHEIKNLQGRSTRFDVDAKDSTGTKYDIEIEWHGGGAAPERGRYNSSILDANSLPPGHEPTELPEAYVIFITDGDPLKGGLNIYHIDRRIGENLAYYNDRSHIIYVSGTNKDTTTDLGKLIHDFRCSKADDMFSKDIADRVRYFKETEKGRQEMSEELEKMREESREEGEVKGIIQTAKEYGASVNQIFTKIRSKFPNLPENDIRGLIAKY